MAIDKASKTTKKVKDPKPIEVNIEVTKPKRKCSRGTDGVLAIDKRYQWCFTSKNFHRSHL
jgi:hypothetical protein